MLNKLRSFLTFTKKEVRKNASSDFVDPLLKKIKADIDILEKSFNHLEHLVDSGFKINFDKIPSENLTDLIEKTVEFSSIIESTDAANKIRLTELLGKIHDNAVSCSSMATFLVNSTSPEQNINKLLKLFENIKIEFNEISKLL